MKTFMVTGASRGLGRALADEVLARGHRLIFHQRTQERKPITADMVVTGDLRDNMTIRKLAQAASQLDMDILINNAAVHVAKPLTDLTESVIIDAVENNLVIPMLLTRAVWQVLRRQRGTVINVNSLASRAPGWGETAYGASKAGLSGFSEALQWEATEHGISVIDVLLGAMQTDMAGRRPDFDQFIDPREAAAAIVDLCESRPSLRVTSIVIKRRRYGS